MKWIVPAALCCAVAVVSHAGAQDLNLNRGEPVATQQSPDQLPSLSNITPEMWLYLQQLQRHDDPKMAVRRKAEERARQRENRLASRRWFGLSNMRPVANPVPLMGTYSPMWVGNSWDEYHWVGVGSPLFLSQRPDYYGPLR